jgi:LacI family transcriptional regulator
MLTLLSKDKSIEAVFIGSDYMAIGAFDALEDKGVKVPEDIALVGFDNTEFASSKRIKLTAVDQRKFEMGTLGVRILIDFIEGGHSNYINRIVLEPHLVIRE